MVEVHPQAVELLNIGLERLQQHHILSKTQCGAAAWRLLTCKLHRSKPSISSVQGFSEPESHHPLAGKGTSEVASNDKTY